MVDLGAGHGLLAQVLLLLDDTSPSAIVVDTALPPSTATLYQALVGVWPRLAGRVEFLAQPMGDVELSAGDLVVSSHACGRLSDVVIDRALAARARVRCFRAVTISMRAIPEILRAGSTARWRSMSCAPHD